MLISARAHGIQCVVDLLPSGSSSGPHRAGCRNAHSALSLTLPRLTLMCSLPSRTCVWVTTLRRCEEANLQWERLAASQQSKGSPVSFGQVSQTLGSCKEQLSSATRPLNTVCIVFRLNFCRWRRQTWAAQSCFRDLGSKSSLAMSCSGTGRCGQCRRSVSPASCTVSSACSCSRQGVTPMSRGCRCIGMVAMGVRRISCAS